MAVSLELGGKAPVIVFEDADLELAVRKAFEARFWNCGQVCTCNERTYVHASLHDEFVARFVELARELRIGDPSSDDTQLGPKVSGPEWDKVKDLVDKAAAGGAEVVLGGGRPEGDRFARGHWFAPTVLTGVGNDMEVVQREVFGPVLPVWKVEDLDEAIERANASEYGLGSSIWTRSAVAIDRATRDLEAGVTWVNQLHYGYDELPFGGTKQSGLGREHGLQALEEYTELKSVVVGGLAQ
jgi:lactaldehyde dehydrogenase/glycolaldehyde dehydrogenase